MLKRLALPAALAAATAALVAVPTSAVAGPGPSSPATAAAATNPDAYLTTEEAPGVVDTRTAGVSLRYACSGGSNVVEVSLTIEGVRATGSAPVTCDGQERGVGVRVDVPTASSGFPVGDWTAQLEATIPGQATIAYPQQVSVPAPLLRTVAITAAKATPKKVDRGRTITVRGTITKDGRPWAAASVDLDFRVDGGSYRYVTTVTSDAKGRLRATVTATRSGSYQWFFTGTTTLAEVRSAGDHVVVASRPKQVPFKR